MDNDITYEITKHIGVIEKFDTGWAMEINMVAWNGGKEKVDIRQWDPNHEKMSRGVTLTKEQFRNMIQVTKERMPGLMVENIDRGAR